MNTNTKTKLSILLLLAFLSFSTGAKALEWSGTQTFTTSQTITQDITIPNAATIDISAGATLTISGVISGYGSLLIRGGGKVILTGANTYTGTTAIYDGITLQIGNGISGSMAGSSGMVIASATATLRFEPGSNMTFERVISDISGPGPFGKVEFKGGVGTKNLTFTANNTFSGAITIEAGALFLGYNTATGSVKGDIKNSGSLVFFRTNDLTYSGVISGSGEVVKEGVGKLILNGANNYTGITSVYGGTLQIGDGTSGSIANTTAVDIAAGAVLRFEPGADMIFDKKISGSGNVECLGWYGKSLFFTANNNYTGTTTVENGGFFLGNNTTTGSVTGNIILRGTNDCWLEFAHSNDYVYSGIISGTGRIIKNQAGTVTLNGANIYAGKTEITAGTLALGSSGSIEYSSGVYVNKANAKFDVSAVDKHIRSLTCNNSGSELIIGSSKLTIDQGLSLTGNTVSMDLTAGSPQIVVNGAVSASGTNTFKIKANSAVSNYVLMKAASGITSTTPYTLDISGIPTGTLSVSSPTQLLLTAPAGTAPTITTASLPSGTVGTAYSATLSATGTTPITWSISAGSLPSGLSLSTAGLISGTPTASGTFSFTVKATNGIGSDTKALSIIIVAPAPVTVNAATPNITYQPQDETVEVGDAVTLSVTATVSDGGTLSWQWYNDNTGRPISGATGRTYSPPTATPGTYSYYVVVTNTNNSVNGTKTATATSNTVTVTVNPPAYAATPVISVQLKDSTVNRGATLTLSVTASVSDGGTLTYQWYDAVTGRPISSATGRTYSPPTATVGTYSYYVVITNTNSSATVSKTATVKSKTVTITVNSPTDIENVSASSSLNAWALNGTLHVSGLTAGKTWSVYSISGYLIYQGIAGNDTGTLYIASHGVYIVQSGNKTVKVMN